MGLDWCLKEKEVDGKKVTPYETLGAKRLYKSDPETVEVFRNIWQSHQKNVEERRANITTIMVNVAAGTAEEKPADRYLEFWGRPFETVLDEVEQEHPVLPDTYKGDEGKSPCSGIAVSAIDLRGKVVCGILREQGNSTMAERCYQEFTPDEMKKFADEIEALTFTRSDDKEFMEQTVAWLRFWADKGHGVSPWY